jgi:hypothetical protein
MALIAYSESSLSSSKLIDAANGQFTKTLRRQQNHSLQVQILDSILSQNVFAHESSKTVIPI